MKSAVNEIHDITEILSLLPEYALHEVKDFAFYLADRERRRKEFEERVLAAEKEKPIRFKSVDEAVRAVFDAPAD